MWKSGRVKFGMIVYYWEAKVYDEGSEFGINGGRISKLFIRRDDGKTAPILNYDRGWDIRPRSKAALEIFGNLLNQYA